MKGKRKVTRKVTRNVEYYTLDVIISVVYRIKSQVGTRLMQEHDRLFPDDHIDIRKWRNESHDRWLIIDYALYHCGQSFDTNGGHHISAITRMGTSPDTILSQIINHSIGITRGDASLVCP